MRGHKPWAVITNDEEADACWAVDCYLQRNLVEKVIQQLLEDYSLAKLPRSKFDQNACWVLLTGWSYNLWLDFKTHYFGDQNVDYTRYEHWDEDCPGHEELVGLIHDMLASSCIAKNTVIIPTLLIPVPAQAMKKYKRRGETMADVALLYLTGLGGLCGDRTRRNVYGYPGLLRELWEPPPWAADIEPQEIGRPLSEERAEELRPLYQQANDQSLDDMVERYRQYTYEFWVTTQLCLQHDFRIPGYEIWEPTLFETLCIERWKKLLLIARFTGSDVFENLMEAVFVYDEFTIASGTPDLFIWNSCSTSPLWFFAEVKGPRDSLRISQYNWILGNWARIQGRILLIRLVVNEST